MKKPRPPRAPYCLCGSLRRWILQQVSPSRYFTYYFSGVNRRANAYFAKLKDYRTNPGAGGFVSAPAKLHRPDR